MTDETPKPELITVFERGPMLTAAVIAFLVGAALVIGAAVILARVGDDHADE